MNKDTKTLLVHGGLFLATFVTTTIAGSEWIHGKSFLYGQLSWEEIKEGFSFSIPFLLIFTFHEFGHYFTARFYKVATSLPYYIPVPPFPGFIGTLGAVIRLKQQVPSTKQNFDIGIAGPLAGFVIAIGVLWYGYTHLPDKEYVYNVHPEYAYFGENYADFVYGNSDTVVTKDMIIERGVMTEDELELYPDTVFSPLRAIGVFGANKTIMIDYFEKYVVPEQDRDKIPNGYELVHYPFLFAGFLALFFTALNLLPIGQLDGGHVIYGLFGRKGHSIIAMISFFGLLLYGGLGLVSIYMETYDILVYGMGLVILYYFLLRAAGISVRDRWMYAVAIFTLQFLVSWLFPQTSGSLLLLVIALMVRMFIGVKHPPSIIEEKLDNNRVILGWISLIILVLCFTPTPFIGV